MIIEYHVLCVGACPTLTLACIIVSSSATSAISIAMFGVHARPAAAGWHWPWSALLTPIGSWTLPPRRLDRAPQGDNAGSTHVVQ